jgi:hypothetical protein
MVEMKFYDNDSNRNVQVVGHTETELRLILQAKHQGTLGISLDRRTAIKFCKQLRSIISQLKD